MLSFLFELTDTGRQAPPVVKEAWSIGEPLQQLVHDIGPLLMRIY